MDNNITPNPSPETPQAVEAQPAVESEQPTSRGPSKKWFIIGGILVVFLAAAAFLGARLLKSPDGIPGLSNIGFNLGGRSGNVMMQWNGVKINMTPAKELPQEKQTVAGLFVRRQDQSIFIGTGRVMMMAKPSSSGSPDITSSYDGPVVEIVIDHNTKIYQDVTSMEPPDPSSVKNGQVNMQQVVKPGSLDELGSNMMVSVWGDKQGDRYIAKVISFK